MTELSALNIKITGDSKDLQAAIAAANGDLAKLVSGAEAAGLKVSKIPFKPAQQGAGRFAQSVRGVTQQLSQVGQQTMATGNFMQALAIQLPDIGLAFGAIGTAAGLLAGIALPMLANALFGTGEAAKSFEDRLGEAESAISRLREITDIYSGESMGKLIERYGQLDTALAAHIQRMREVAEATALANTQAMLNQVVDDLGGLDGIYNGLADTFNLLEEEAVYLGNQMRWALSEDEPKKQIAALEAVLRQMETITGGYDQMNSAQQRVYDSIVQSVDQLRILTATQPGEGWLSAAISSAQGLANSLWEAVAAKAALSDQGYAALGDDERGSQRGVRSNAGAFRSQQAIRDRASGQGQGGGGGGGGGGVNPLQAELEAIQEGLMTAEQLQMESYMRQQETLKGALEQRLITQEEYQRLMQQAQSTHDFAMQQSVNQGVSATLGHLGTLFQGSKKISAAIAVANSWLAFTEVLKDPAYVGRPWARIAAAGAALSSGLNAVRNIKSASVGGAGGGGGAGAQAVPAQQNVQTLNFTVQNDQFGIGANLIRQIATQLNEAQRNGSTLIRANVV